MNITNYIYKCLAGGVSQSTWDSFNELEKDAYLQNNPNSKYAEIKQENNLNQLCENYMNGEDLSNDELNMLKQNKDFICSNYSYFDIMDYFDFIDEDYYYDWKDKNNPSEILIKLNDNNITLVNEGISDSFNYNKELPLDSQLETILDCLLQDNSAIPYFILNGNFNTDNLNQSLKNKFIKPFKNPFH